MSRLVLVTLAVAVAAPADANVGRSPEGQSAAHGYGGELGILAAVLLAVIAIPVGLLIARVGSRRGARGAG